MPLNNLQLFSHLALPIGGHLVLKVSQTKVILVHINHSAFSRCTAFAGLF